MCFVSLDYTFLLSQFSGQKTGGCLDSLCVFPTCAIIARAPHKFSSSTTAHLNIIGGAQCTIFFQIYLEQVLVNELKNSWVDSWVSKLVKPVSWWYRPLPRRYMRPRSMFLRNCYSNLIGWSNPLQQPMMWTLTGDWIRILPGISEFNVVWCVISYLLTDEGQYPETSIRIGSSNVISLYCVL